MMKRIFPFLFLLLFVPLGAQAQDAQVVRYAVQNYLVGQMAREAQLVEYNFEGRTWPDGALGCPVGDETPDAGEVSGYRWAFLMDDGMRYILHSDAAGEKIVLCASESAPAFSYSVYTGNLFTVRHPNLWTARPQSQEETRFYFRGQATCTLPGMRVLATVSAGSPTDLLSAYFSGVAEAPNPDTYKPIGPEGLGRLARYSLDCEGVQITQQVAALSGATNTAFLILQSAPAGIFPAWEATFLEMLNSFEAGSGSVLGMGADVAAAGTPLAPTPTQMTVSGVGVPTPAFTATPSEPVPQPPTVQPIDVSMIPLANVFVGDIYIGRLNDLPGWGITMNGAAYREGLRISTDALQLAYLESGALYTVALINPESPNRIAEQTILGMPPAWGPQQPALAYALPTDDGLQLERIFPDGTRETVGEAPYRGDCEDTAAYTVERLYQQETGLNGNGLTLEWLPDERFLISAGCDGVGLQILDATSGEIVRAGETLRRAKLSPDRTRIAALEGDQLVVVDLATLEATSITTALVPDQIAWDVTGTQIFYSNLFPNEPLIFNDSSMQAAAQGILEPFPFESRLNTLTLSQVDTHSGIEVQLWQGTGFAIGQIQGGPDGTGFLFSLIPSDRGLLTNFVNGAQPAVVRNSTPETQLYWLTIDYSNPNAAAQLLAFTGQPIFAPITGAALLPTATATP